MMVIFKKKTRADEVNFILPRYKCQPLRTRQSNFGVNKA